KISTISPPFPKSNPALSPISVRQERRKTKKAAERRGLKMVELGRCVAAVVDELLKDGQERAEHGFGSGLRGLEGTFDATSGPGQRGPVPASCCASAGKGGQHRSPPALTNAGREGPGKPAGSGRD